MPSETLLPRGAQQRDGMDGAGVEGLTCAQRGDLAIRIAGPRKRSLMARPCEKKLELARRMLEVTNCQSSCGCCRPEANWWLKGL